MLLRAALAALFVLVLAGCGGGDGGRGESTRPLVLATGSTRLSCVVVQYMEAAGLAAAQDLPLEYTVTSTATSSALMAGLLSGDYDFIAPGTPTAIDAVSKGAPIQIVASIARTPDVLVMRRDVMARLGVARDAPQDDRVRALKGLRIGTSPAGTSTYDRVRAVVRTVGIDPDRDITLLGVADGSALAAGLRTGLYDAVWVAVGDTEPLIVEGLAGQWLSYSDGDFPDLAEKALVVVATTRTIESNPEAVRRLRAALQASADGIRSNPDAAAALLKQKWFAAMDQAAFDIAWSSGRSMPPEDVDFTRDDLARSQRIVELAGAKAVQIDYDTLVADVAQGSA